MIYSILLLISTLFYLPAQPEIPLSEADTVYFSESGSAEFTSDVPLHSFTGKSDHLTGLIDPQENLIDFYLDLNTLKTGIGKRDRDMYSALNADDHPFAEFTGSLDSLALPTAGQEIQVTANGEFTMNDISKTISVDGTLTNTGEGLHLRASFPVLLSDFDVEPPGILFYRVEDEQSVEIDVLLKPTPKDQL